MRGSIFSIVVSITFMVIAVEKPDLAVPVLYWFGGSQLLLSVLSLGISIGEKKQDD